METNTNEGEPRTPSIEKNKEPEPYGWEFHKGPLAIALILTVIFYAFVYFFVKS